MSPAAERGELQPEIETLRALIREAHETLKDLRTERRAVEQLVAGIEGHVQRAVAGLIEAQVAEQVAALGKVTEKAMRDSVAKAGRERPEGDTLEDQLRRAAARGLTRTGVAP